MIKYCINLCLFVSISVSLYGQDVVLKPKLVDKESFSMVILPDPQGYTKFSANQPIFELMTAWVEKNIDSLAIKAVLCTGDLVEQNEYILPDGKNGDQTSKEQWNAASKAFERLDNKVPYIVSLGNHDYGYTRSENRLCQFPAYFPVERNNKWEKCLVGICNNAFGLPTLENSAYAFHDNNWGGILVITTEFAPRDEVLEWAKNLADAPKYKDYKVFVLTHSYLTWDGRVIEKENYKISPANYGKAIWDKLLYLASNIRMLICGHYCLIGDFKHNVGLKTNINSGGKKVFQMMFNAQTAGGGWNGNGGDGWLRYMEFMPDGKTIKIKTYSPFFGFSPTTAKYAWRTNEWDEFEIVIE
jgi:hypothetical protein